MSRQRPVGRVGPLATGICLRREYLGKEQGMDRLARVPCAFDEPEKLALRIDFIRLRSAATCARPWMVWVKRARISGRGGAG